MTNVEKLDGLGILGNVRESLGADDAQDTSLDGVINNLTNSDLIAWTVKMFIEDLEPAFDMVMSGQSWQEPFKNDEELKRWCMDNQPYYKKPIPEVFKYFKGKMKQFKRS